MASQSLGTLTYDLVARIGGFTSGLDKAEKAAAKRAKAIEETFDKAAVGVGVAFGLMTTAAVGAFAAINRGIDEAAKFQDLSEMTGAAAEELAGFQVAAATAGVSIEDVAGAMIKLSKNLVGVDDESKAAGAALKNLGINVEAFKKLDPVAQYEAVSKALAGFADGAGKTTTAIALFGKAGAEQLKVMKALEEQGGRINILTKEQIALADEYADKNAKLRAEISLHAAALATQFLPAITAVGGAIRDLIKQFTDGTKAQNDFAVNLTILDWAEKVALAIGTVIEAITGMGRALYAVGGSFQSVFADLQLAAKLPVTAAGLVDFAKTGGKDLKDALDNRNKVAAEANQRYINLWNEDGTKITKAIKKSFADQRAVINNMQDPEIRKLMRLSDTRNNPALPQLKAPETTKPGRGGGSDTAAQEAKAQLQADLADIKAAQDAIVNTYQNAGKILEAERSAGLKDEQEYYAEKKRLLLVSNEAEQAGLRQTIERLQAEKLSGKDAIDNARKITEAQAKLTKAREDAATSVQVLAIQEESAYKKIAGALLAARQAAEDYFETTNRGYERMLGGLGGGNKQRDQLAAIQQIEDRYQQQRQDLANRRSQAELQAGGALTAAQAKQYEDQLAIINEFQDKAVSSYQSYYGRLDAAQKDWSIGATEALRNYADEASNTAKLTEQVFSNAFSSMEDALVEFTKTGKLNFKGLIDSIVSDIARLAIKQAITGPLANSLAGAIGGGGGDWLSSLFKGSSASAVGSSMNFWEGGYTGAGGKYEPAGIVHKGEYVLTAEETKAIGVNNLKNGNMGGFNQVNNFTVQGTIDRRTETQLATSVRRQTNTAASRFA